MLSLCVGNLKNGKIMKRIISLVGALCLATMSHAALIADIAGDYVDENTLPTGWQYLYSDASTGGTEGALTAGGSIGNMGNTGFTVLSGYNIGVLGSSSGTYAIFDSDENSAVQGMDLLLHPGNTTPAAHVIVRYTFSAADILNGTSATIAGSFRDLTNPGTGGQAGSVDLWVYHNSTSLFNFDNGPAVGGITSQADGTFNIARLTVAEGDTVSFVLGNNGVYSGDETALTGTISLSPAVTNPPPTVTMETLLNEMADRTEVARFPDESFRLINFSSYDRDSTSPDEDGWFDNTDRYGVYIRTEVNEGRTEYVLLDHQAPGALVRSWMPWEKPGYPASTSIMRVYIDGSSTPVIEGNPLELFDGTGFVPYPFAHPSLKSAVSFFPISYGKSCKITLDESPFFYIFTCREYTTNTVVESFTMENYNASSNLTTQVGEALLDPTANLPVANVSWQGTIATNATAVLNLPAGTNAVYEFTVELGTGLSDDLMRALIVKAEFDGQDTIWCPLSDFFGSGVGLHSFEGWYRTVETNGTLTCRWVMPYQTNATLSIENTYNVPVTLAMSAATEPWAWDDRSMYFCAGWRIQNPVATRPYSDWNYVTLMGGRGVCVGDSLTVYNPVDKWWGEGDHKIWVDGESFPSMFGTGTEDYYGYSYGAVGFYEHPFHAQVRCGTLDKVTSASSGTLGYSTETRTRSLDTIPFTNSLQLDMEVWSWTDTNMEYAVATYWYADPQVANNLSREDPELSISTNSLDFGPVAVGESKDLTLTVENVGGSVLTGTVTADAPFSIVSGGAYSLSSLQAQNVVVRYKPEASEADFGSMLLTGTNVSVSGRGYVSLAVVCADARADYRATTAGGTTLSFNGGTGIVDQDGNGRWNYYESSAVDAADYIDGSTFEPLVFASTIGNDGNSGYRDPENSTYTPIISNARAFSDSIELSTDKLAIHPGSDADEACVVARWTAGAGESGEIRLRGEAGRGSTNLPDGDGREFYILKGNSDGTAFTLLKDLSFGDVTTADTVSIDLITTIAEGEHIDFVANRKGNHSADEIHFSAFISPIDSDADGMPDEWESQHAGSLTHLTATGDYDGDGLADSAEYVAGTNPTNSASVLAVSALVLDPDLYLEWDTVPDRIYSIYWSTNLIDGFTCVESNLPWTSNSYLHTEYGHALQGFYQLEVQLDN
jgi:hypothetical protein